MHKNFENFGPSCPVLFKFFKAFHEVYQIEAVRSQRLNPQLN
jgi:hypothetical protein